MNQCDGCEYQSDCTETLFPEEAREKCTTLKRALNYARNEIRGVQL